MTTSRFLAISSKPRTKTSIGATIHVRSPLKENFLASPLITCTTDELVDVIWDIPYTIGPILIKLVILNTKFGKQEYLAASDRLKLFSIFYFLFSVQKLTTTIKFYSWKSFSFLNSDSRDRYLCSLTLICSHMTQSSF